jgi:hypothetical protein
MNTITTLETSEAMNRGQALEGIKYTACMTRSIRELVTREKEEGGGIPTKGATYDAHYEPDNHIAMKTTIIHWVLQLRMQQALLHREKKIATTCILEPALGDCFIRTNCATSAESSPIYHINIIFSILLQV